jgi:hypothetical protein
LTYKFSNAAAEKITKYENLDLDSKNIWKLNNVSVYPLGMSAEGEVTRSFQKYLEIIRFK